MQRHRHQEFIRFLNAIEREVPAGKVVHVILDNYAAHKHEKVRAWLDRHPRWTFHFAPTSSSWLNAVEGFFAILTRRRLRHGVFRSVADLQEAINRFIKNHNRDPKPFSWKADPEGDHRRKKQRVPSVGDNPLAGQKRSFPLSVLHVNFLLSDNLWRPPPLKQNIIFINCMIIFIYIMNCEALQYYICNLWKNTHINVVMHSVFIFYFLFSA